MLLDGRELAAYIKERQARQVRSLAAVPRLAIVRQGASPATDIYLRVKRRYGEDIGVAVDCYTESPDGLIGRINRLNADPAVGGINVELPLADAPGLTDQALAAVQIDKDVEGLAPGTAFDRPTPMAIRWLLSAYGVELAGRRIVIVGQGRLVGRPLADELEACGHDVRRLDERTADLAKELGEAEVIVTATGQPSLVTSAMVRPGAVVVDAGSPVSDLSPELRRRTDVSLTPNPGGVGPVTVAALFDNLLQAVQVDLA